MRYQDPPTREWPEHRCPLRHGDAKVSRAAPETPGARLGQERDPAPVQTPPSRATHKSAAPAHLRQTGAMRADELEGSHGVTAAASIARRLRGGGRCSCFVRGADATLVVIVLAASMLAWPVVASAVLRSGVSSVDAPGLSAGPFITDTGLVWESSDGIMLTSSAGRSTVLARPDAPSWNGDVDLAWFGRGWWALARPSGVLAARIGGRLRPLPLLRKCDPATSLAPGALAGVQYAVSGHYLYAALRKGCLARRRARFGEVVGLDLRSRRWHVLTSMPGTLDYMAASGKYLALAYWRSKPRSAAEARPFVRVLDAATGAVVSQITPPPIASGETPSTTSGIQVDERGDVLIIEGCCGELPGQLAHIAQPSPERSGWWWARAGSTVGHETHLGSDAVLSDGRVAFLSTDASSPNSTRIEVRNLLAGTTRTLVVFSGSVSAHSLALSGNELAWDQQSTVLNVESSPTFESCTTVALSPPELAHLDLRDIPATPVAVSGVPIPPPYATGHPASRAEIAAGRSQNEIVRPAAR